MRLLQVVWILEYWDIAIAENANLSYRKFEQLSIEFFENNEYHCW
jgi:hypothetical protein